MVINKDHDLLDSAKRYKSATAPGVDQKLNSTQKKVIAMNGAVLALYMNRVRARFLFGEVDFREGNELT